MRHELCTDEGFMRRYLVSLIIISIHPPQTCDRGWALRAKAAAKKGAVLLEYLGEVVTAEEVYGIVRHVSDVGLSSN